MAKIRYQGLLRWLYFLPLPLLWCLVESLGLLRTFEEKSIDWRFLYRGEIEAPVKLVYVDIDSDAINVIGNWPWDRAIFARTCEALLKHSKVRAIGVDAVFSDYGTAQLSDTKRLVAGNREFAGFLRKDPPVVLAASFAASTYYDATGAFAERGLPLQVGETRPLSQVEDPEKPSFRIALDAEEALWSPARIGLIDTRDGQTRWVPLLAQTNIQTYHHLGLALTQLYLGAERVEIDAAGEYLRLRSSEGKRLRDIPLHLKQFLEINWFTAWDSPKLEHVSIASVYANVLHLNRKPGATPEEAEAIERERRNAEAFFAQPFWKDSLVLIGPVDKLLQDLGPAPFDLEPVPKVAVHGNVIKTILSERYLQRLPLWSHYLLIVGLTFGVMALATTSGSQSAFAKTLAVLVGLSYLVIIFELFRHLDLILPFNTPLLSAFSCSFVAIVWQLVEEEKQKGRIKGMFGTYLSPTVVQNLIDSGKNPELGGHDAEITAYFSDIQSFSSFSEVMSSSQLGELLNEYLSACTDLVQEEGGTLDKYIGDAIVAMYGAPLAAPDHAYRACIAALRVQGRTAELREKWRLEGKKWPSLVHKLQARIGLNTGVCMIGNMGSRTRFNYTMMGDNVNLAARMESGAKAWGVYTMCTEATRAACEAQGPGQLVFRPLGRIIVKGRSKAVPIYEIVGFRKELTDKDFACLDLFAKGLERMYQRDFEGALVYFRQSLPLERNQVGISPGVKANASSVRLERIEALRTEPPPEDWDGVEVMTEK